MNQIYSCSVDIISAGTIEAHKEGLSVANAPVMKGNRIVGPKSLISDILTEFMKDTWESKNAKEEQEKYCFGLIWMQILKMLLKSAESAKNSIGNKMKV